MLGIGLGSSLNLGNLLVHLRADDSLFNSTLTRSVKTMTRWTKRIAIAGTVKLTLSVKAFSAFEEQMANVSTMLDEQTMRYMPAYTEAMKIMSVEFGESTKTLTKGLYDILSATIPPAQALEVLAVSAKAARAGMTSTAVAADAITTVMKSYGMGAEEASRISDILFATVKRGKTTFAELAPTLGKVTSIAATAGLSFEELSASIASMTRAGLPAALATTSLRSILNSFLKPTDDATAAAAAYDIGLSSATLAAEGLTGVMLRLKGASAEQIAAMIPNTRGIAGFAAMLRQGAEHMYDLNFMIQSTGRTQQAYDKMTQTLTFTMRRLWQSVKVTSVEVGSRLAPSLKKLADSIIANQYVIQDWAVAFTDRIVFVKEILWAFVTNFKSNWLPTLTYVLDASVIMFKTFGKQLGVLGAVAADAFTLTFVDRIAAFYVDFGKKSFWEKVKSPLASAFAATMAPLAEAIFKHSEKMKEGATNIKEAMTIIATETNKAMSALKGPDLKGDFGIAFDNLARKDFFRKWHAGVRELKTNLAPVLDMFDLWKKKVQGVADTFLKMNKEEEKADGARFNTYKKSLEMAEAYKEIRGKMGRVTLAVYKAELIALNKQREIYKAAGIDVNSLTAWHREQAAVLEIEYLKSSDSWAKGFKAAGMQIKREMQTKGEMAYDFGIALEQSIEKGLENTLRNFTTWKDAIKGMLEEIYWEAVRIAFIKPVAGYVTQGLMTGLGSLGGAGGTPTTDATGAGATGYHQYASGGIAWNPQIATLAENEPELITPFSQLKNLMGGGQGTIKVEMHNEGTQQTISKVESYIMSDQRIIDVWTKDALGEGDTARTVRTVSKRK